ncbi:12590_t:CDS:2 [Ambispora gerdemannii]|uniref:Kinase n=1 Tax=Ambispora gerdemannii TaxID=144530 RepID=A0A9N9CY46_9GLOM|nr:12590_t:CDS:2 [Ambispora gerdemannii]
MTNTALQSFEHQLGGHKKLLSMNDGSILVKPSNTIEREFYENSVLYPEFAQWIPRYFGSLQLQGVQSQLATIATNIVDSVEANGTVGGVGSGEGTICIENITCKFKKPCMLDLKLGIVLYGPDADEAKRQKMIKKAESSTSSTLGIRITAMKVYEKSKNSFIIYPREFGYSLTKDTVFSGFAKYFDVLQDSPPHNLRSVVIKRFIDDLQEFHKVLENHELRLHSASLLFVYEGDEKVLADALEQEKQQGDIGGKKPNTGIGRDEGCLLGLNNTINYLRQLLVH